ncbi:MAG: hypothetical protein Q7S22_04485 [Candidatus Micrarchaeota archaeon]|nr:hypothetical protein [Candidatus Micrarchaeota archaeon]
MSSRKIILPGDRISDKVLRMPNTYIENEMTYAAVVGMSDETGKFISLESCYKPVFEDVLIGIVTDVRHSGYSVDINLPSSAFVSARDMRTPLNAGDVIAAKVVDVDEVGEVSLGDIRKLPRGEIITFPPSKVPRLIGRKSSMLLLIKEHVGGELIVGNNGFVWVSESADIPLVYKAVNLVIEKAHLTGLTDNMQEFLIANKK